MEGKIELKSLVKKYDHIQVVHGIDLEIEPGEFIVLVGPSGCGKSTTLRMIAGLEEISGGDIHISGKRVNDLSPKERNISMVFQNYALYPHMSVYDNMAFSLKLSNIPEAVILEKVREAASILNLEEYLTRKPSELSGGQRQRVAMGRAIVRDPSVFLFDEPLSNLDAKLRSQMRTEIKKLHYKMKKTIVYVTHDQVEAMTLADRIVVMKDGYIEQVGTPLELYNNPVNTFVAEFMGSPPMNIIDIEKSDDTLKEIVHFKGDNYLVGMRPEKIRIEKGDINFSATVDLIEPLGAENLVHVKICNDQRMTIRTEADVKYDYKETLNLSISKNDIHFFDKKFHRAT